MLYIFRKFLQIFRFFEDVALLRLLIPLIRKFVIFIIGCARTILSDQFQIIFICLFIPLKQKFIDITLDKQFFRSRCIKTVAFITGIGSGKINLPFFGLDWRFLTNRINDHMQFFHTDRALISNQIKVISEP